MVRPLTAPFPPSVSAHFMVIESYSSYTDQRKVETSIEVTEDQIGDLLLQSHALNQLKVK